MMRIFLLLLFIVSMAMADRDGGPYLGFGYGISEFDDAALYGKLKEDRSNSYTLYAGAYINKHLSVEFGYVSFNTQDTKAYKTQDDTMIKIKVAAISTLAHYAFLDDRLDFYAKFGVGEIRMPNTTQEGFSFVAGGGTAWRFSEKLALKVAYDFYDFDYTAVDKTSYSMNIQYVYTALEVQF
jgi:hypothetical protein